MLGALDPVAMRLLVLIVVRVVLGLGHLLIARSEEHTSELQSPGII